MLTALNKLSSQEHRSRNRGSTKRGSSSRPSASSSLIDEGAVIRTGKLYKQGGSKVKHWKHRFFVLNRNGIFYYLNETSYSADPSDFLPNSVYFCDLTILQGRTNAAEEIPMSLRNLKKNYNNPFALFTRNRTYVLGAKTSELRREWIDDINQVFKKFCEDRERRENLMNSAWLIGDDEGLAEARKLIKGESEFGKVQDNMEYLLKRKIASDFRMLVLKRQCAALFYSWQLVTRFGKKKNDQKTKKY